MTIPDEGKPLVSSSLPPIWTGTPPRRKCRGKLWWLYVLLLPGGTWVDTVPVAPELDPLLLLLFVMVPTPELLLVLLKLLPVTPYATIPFPRLDSACWLGC